MIGEVALTHDGSLGLAHAFVDHLLDVGAASSERMRPLLAGR